MCVCVCTQGNQKVSVHLMITIQSSGAQRIFDRPVCVCMCVYVFVCVCACIYI